MAVDAKASRPLAMGAATRLASQRWVRKSLSEPIGSVTARPDSAKTTTAPATIQPSDDPAAAAESRLLRNPNHAATPIINEPVT